MHALLPGISDDIKSIKALCDTVKKNETSIVYPKWYLGGAFVAIILTLVKEAMF